jgi:hypothetical protein
MVQPEELRAARVRKVGLWLCLLPLLKVTRGHAALGLHATEDCHRFRDQVVLLLGNIPGAGQGEEAGAGNGDVRDGGCSKVSGGADSRQSIEGVTATAVGRGGRMIGNGMPG